VLQLAPHIVDGGIELLHPVMQMALTGSVAIAPLAHPQGRQGRLSQLLKMAPGLTAALGGGQQPPGEPGGAENGTGQG